MSIERKRTETVYGIIKELVSAGRSTVRPGDVNSVLRDRAQPMGTWEVRGEFSRLEAEGLIACDDATGNWSLTEAGLKKTG